MGSLDPIGIIHLGSDLHMFVKILLDSLFLLEVQIVLLRFEYLVGVFKFPRPFMISVDIERRITIEYMKSKVSF